MEFYTVKQKEPKHNQLSICHCPHWCELEYQIAKWDDRTKTFDYPESPNHDFNRNVVSWAPLEH